MEQTRCSDGDCNRVRDDDCNMDGSGRFDGAYPILIDCLALFCVAKI